MSAGARSARSAEHIQRAARVRETAELVGAILADVVEVVVAHADDIAEWSLNRHANRDTMPVVKVPSRRSG